MRVTTFVAVGLLLVGPLLPPLFNLFAEPASWRVWGEAERLADLLANTLGLCLGTVLVAGPLGWLLGLWAGRFGGRVVRGTILLAAFVPLPIYALAWQTIFGHWLPSLNLDPGQVAWRAWTIGLIPAAWVHAMAAIPWVAWAVSTAVRRTDPDLEDEALQTGGPANVLHRVLLPRSVGAAFLAGVWVAAQPLTEITVTDAMMVRSVAEEVYTQLIVETGGLAGAVATALPVWFLATLAVWTGSRRLDRFQIPAPNSEQPRLLLLPRLNQGLFRLLVWVSVLLFAVVPLLALVWKAAGGGRDQLAKWDFFVNEVHKVLRSESAVILSSLFSAVVVGLGTACIAWMSCTLARQSRSCQRMLFVLVAVLLFAPGPVVGLGLKRFIALLLDLEELIMPGGPFAQLLYRQPSPVPGAWAAMVRFFPVACVLIWPAIRAIPDELLDAARLDGWTGWMLWNRLVVPLTTPAFLTAAVAVAALALGEVSAGKLVSPPGHRTYILWLFDQMHYGSESTLAAMALTQLLLTGVVVGLIGLTAASVTSSSVRNAR